MENPFKKLSSISPQKEKGSRSIANGVFNALTKARLSGPAYQSVLMIITFTWGFGKAESAEISLTQFMAVTGLTKQGTIKTLKALEQRRVIVVERRYALGSLPVNLYHFNKYYDTWLNQTGKPQFTTLDIKYINKFYAQTGKPQFTTSSSKPVNHSLPLNDQTGKPEDSKLVNSGIGKLVNPSLPNNIKKSIKRNTIEPETPKQLKSLTAEKTRKDMKGKKPLKLGKPGTPEETPFEPF